MRERQKYIAFLRGINVGGKHKVPMLDLRKKLEDLGFTKISTLLNSGNIIFEGDIETTSKLEKNLEKDLEHIFGFVIPCLIRTENEMQQVFNSNVFENIVATKNTRFYVSFIKENTVEKPLLPLYSEDKSYSILALQNRTIFSVLDVTKTATPKAMAILENYFGKNITTRNWNTIEKISDKLI